MTGKLKMLKDLNTLIICSVNIDELKVPDEPYTTSTIKGGMKFLRHRLRGMKIMCLKLSPAAADPRIS